MKVIGIIGGIGAGKSMISQTFANLYNAYVIELDKIGHRVILKDGPAYHKVIQLLGEKILDESDEIDRKIVSNLVFEDEQLLDGLNKIIHEEVFLDLRNHLSALLEMNYYDFVICEAALLVEDEFLPLIDELWYVRADRDIRKKRLMDSRHMSEEKINAIMDKQHEDSYYAKFADLIIDNNNDITDSFEKIHRRVQWLMEEENEK